MNKTIMIISATTRPGRMGKPVTDWVEKTLGELSSDITYTSVHLDELQLPFLDEPMPPMMDQYKNDHTKEWSEKVSASDGFIMVTPEYNAGYPAPLKNAIDYLYKEWASKPVAFVGYGAGPATNAIKQLKEVTERLKMQNIETSVTIPNITEAMDENGVPKPEAINGTLASIDAALAAHLEG